MGERRRARRHDLGDGATAGEGRVAIAEDNDEFGARWVVAGATAGTVEIVQRRYILNADPADPDEVEGALADLGTDPRRSDLPGPAAAEAAARLFAVPVTPMITAEAESAESWQELGVVGGRSRGGQRWSCSGPRKGSGKPWTGDPWTGDERREVHRPAIARSQELSLRCPDGPEWRWAAARVPRARR